MIKLEHINDNDKTNEKYEYCNKNLNELGMNDANRAYKNILKKSALIWINRLKVSK